MGIVTIIDQGDSNLGLIGLKLRTLPLDYLSQGMSVCGVICTIRGLREEELEAESRVDSVIRHDKGNKGEESTHGFP